jgi:hypothetical protein
MIFGIPSGMRPRSAGVSLEDRQDLLGHHAERIAQQATLKSNYIQPLTDFSLLWLIAVCCRNLPLSAPPVPHETVSTPANNNHLQQ